MIQKSLLSLKAYCEKEEFKGWDPYDGLNSKVFQSIPFLRNWDLARLVWIQLFKQSPVNLRGLFNVPKDYNAKGIALYLTGYCNILNAQNLSGNEDIGSMEQILNKINYLAKLLISLQSEGYSGACWGYNFDWKSKAFFLPKGTPTIVATSFAVEALIKAYEITKNEKYLNKALSSKYFILNDLNRIQKKNGFMFSYSPLDQRAVYNATLLATKTLSLIYKYTGKEECRQLALISAQTVCGLQNSDGSFPHSDQVGNRWRDNFHTAFKLESLAYYRKYCYDNTFNGNIENGYKYWLENYFDKQTGKSLYYEHNEDLIDLHCAAQSIPTFYSLEKFKSQNPLIDKIIEWAIVYMQSELGYFYFQKKKSQINKIPYMRWPNAWMFYGMSYYLLGEIEDEKNKRAS